MPVMQLGEKLNSLYLERFSPPENVPIRVSVLSTSIIATEYHWVDIPRADVKGSFKCCGGSCCQLFGVRRQAYHIPIYVYSGQDTSGSIFDWAMTKSVYNDLCALASRYDLTKYDLEVVVTRLGQGRRTAINIVPDGSRRSAMTQQQIDSLTESVNAFISSGESTLVQDMNEQGYLDLAVRGGYNFQTHSWDVIPQMGGTGAGLPNMMTFPAGGHPQTGLPPVGGGVYGSPPPVHGFSQTGLPPTPPPVQVVGQTPTTTPVVHETSQQSVGPAPVATPAPQQVDGQKPLSVDEIDSLLDI